jgi:hypothetical protein
VLSLFFRSLANRLSDEFAARDRPLVAHGALCRQYQDSDAAPGEDEQQHHCAKRC